MITQEGKTNRRRVNLKQVNDITTSNLREHCKEERGKMQVLEARVKTAAVQAM